MNDVKRCSISGIAFTLEMDAWEELSRYLEELHNQYRDNPDGEEIIADIEARIAELILSAQNNDHTVALPLVQNIIAQMGSAAEIGSESSHEEGSAQGSSNSSQGTTPRIPRRLYRDAEQGKLGGVCAGLANYFDIDPVWIRLVVFLPVFIELLLPDHWFPYWVNSLAHNIFGIIAVCYLIMWFVVPSARSARQRLEMRGERITADSIGQATAQSRSDVDGRSRTVVSDTVSTFGQVMLILLKIFAGILLLGLVLVSCALIIGAFALCFTPEAREAITEVGYGIPLLGILTVLFPCLMIIYVLMCLVASRRPSGKAVLATFIAWVLIIIGLLVLSIRHGLHEELYHELLPTPTYNNQNLLNDPTVALTPTEEAEITPTEESEITPIEITTPEGRVEMKVSEKGLRIKVQEEGEEPEEVSINLPNTKP